MKKIWAWTVAIVSAIVALIGGFIVYGRRQRSAGEAVESREADKRDVQAADKAGDDDGVLNDWRKANKS